MEKSSNPVEKPSFEEAAKKGLLTPVVLDDTKSSEGQEFNALHPEIYEAYCLWKSLPSFFRFPPKDKRTGNQPSPREYAAIMGIDDPRILELVDIRTQGEFAERHGVHPETLTRWNKTMAVRQSLQDIRVWGRQLTKNVLLSLYNNAIRKGQALEVKLFMQLIEQWEEKLQVEHDYKGITQFTVIKNENKPADAGNKAPTPPKVL